LVVAVKYAAFAAVATGCNLGSQALMDRGYRGSLTVYVSLFLGTLVGLVVKYLLDKRFIFYDSIEGLARRGWQFVRYALTGLVTTAVFWGLELGAFHAFHTQAARYLGGAAGLAVGYWLKYQLDKRLVFAGAQPPAPTATVLTTIQTSRDTTGERVGELPVVFSLIRALRPKQWLKNLLVFAAPAAGGVIAQFPVLGRTAAAFVAFCTASSALYLVNDVVDVESDRLHPEKSRRPIAAGRVSVRVALIAAGLLLLAGEFIGFRLGYRFFADLTLYVALVLAYSFWLKRVVLLDILIIAAGFVLRAVAGGLATGIADSEWFLLLVSLGALFVVTGKRYADIQFTPDLGAQRNGAPHYNAALLLYLAIGLAVASTATYAIWVFGVSTHALSLLTPLSIAPFALAMGRYAFLVAAKRGGAPEDLFVRDRALILAVLVWLALYGGGIYIHV
jgi:decaprenyl-phosphate phosphoribosyltransferase